MSDLGEAFVGATEIHDLDRMRSLLDAGLSPRAKVRGKTLVRWLTEMYFRSDRFPSCLRLLLDRGAVLDDPAIAPVLLDDPDAVAAAVRAEPSLLHHRTTMVSAFTPLTGASLLHVAAEYGNRGAARALLELGADPDATAAVDAHGFGGHTPIFHTVNSNANRSEPLMCLLVEAGARTDIRLPGIIWGQGFEWETPCFDVTPISYAQLGLLRQFQRTERDIYANIHKLLAAAGRQVPPIENVPNRYLYPTGGA